MRKIYIFLLILLVSVQGFAGGDRPCYNPFSTVDWKYFIEGLDFKAASCVCTQGTQVKVGAKATVWEPVAFIEVVKESHKYPCLDMRLKRTLNKSGSNKDGAENGKVKKNVHYIKYPIFAVLNMVMDYLCVTKGIFDIAVPSEFHPLQNNDTLANILNPDRLLFNNPIAQIACLYDCIQSTVWSPANALYWCAGCWGSFTSQTTMAYGKNALSDNAFLTLKEIDLMHTQFQLWKTSEAGALDYIARAVGGVNSSSLCQVRPFPRVIKSQYKLNLSYPFPGKVFKNGSYPFWAWFKSLPGAEDSIFTLWQRNDCCLGLTVIP